MLSPREGFRTPLQIASMDRSFPAPLKVELFPHLKETTK